MAEEEVKPEEYLAKLGNPLEGPGVVMIVEAIKRRQTNFPDEPLEMTVALILMNIGDRFTPLRCENKEWRGLKKDLVVAEDTDPTCPNGHDIIKERGLTLGWVIDNS